MIEKLDDSLHEKIITDLKVISDKGYQSNFDISSNSLRILFGSTYFTADVNTMDEYSCCEVGIEYDMNNSLEYNTTQHKYEMVSDIVRKEFDNHVRAISQYCYYIDISNEYHGPVFISKQTALITAHTLNRDVNFTLSTVDSDEIVEISFNQYPDYTFYGLPGNENNSYSIYTNVEELRNKTTQLKQIGVWNENFKDHVDVIINYPFEDGDAISILLHYNFENINEDIFNQTIGDLQAGSSVEPRIYHMHIKLKKTRIDEKEIISFSDVFLKILKSDDYNVTIINDVIKIRINLEFLIYYKNMIQISEDENTMLAELNNTATLIYLFNAIKLWQVWYNSWYLVGNPSNEKNTLIQNLEIQKTEIINLNQSTNIIDFLLNNIY